VLEHFPPSETIAVSIELPANLPKFFVDPRQVEQVLGNLVINACQAMKAGGRLIISAQASTSKDGQPAVCIRVKDTGSGISPENMPKIFEPLFTTKASGIGLGLAVS